MYSPLQYLFNYAGCIYIFCTYVMHPPLKSLTHLPKVLVHSSKNAYASSPQDILRITWSLLLTMYCSSFQLWVTSANICPHFTHVFLPTRNHDPMTCAAAPRWASASSPPHAAASAPLSRWASDESWCFTIHIEEDTIYVYIYKLTLVYNVQLQYMHV